MRFPSTLTLPLALASVLAMSCVGEDGFGDIAAVEASGYGNLSLEWSISAGDTLRTCADAGAESVEVIARGFEHTVQSLSCWDGLADTDLLAAGDYEISVALVSGDGVPLDVVDIDLIPVRAERTTPLGAVAFAMGD